MELMGKQQIVMPGKSRCSSGVERILGKDEVMGSIPIIGS